MTLGMEEIVIKVYNSDDEVYGKKVEITPNVIDNMGNQILGGESLRTLLDVLNKAYDTEFYWENGDIRSTHNEKIWEKVKNINTDEELEEIKRLLRI